MSAVLDRDVAVGEVVRNDGDVAAHGGRWVGKRSTELDSEAVRGIGIVTGPVLRPVVQKAGIETSTARGAALP